MRKIPPRLYEDYIERGPGSDLGDFTGVPMNDEAMGYAASLYPEYRKDPAVRGKSEAAVK